MLISPRINRSRTRRTRQLERLNQYVEGLELSAKDPHSNQLIVYSEESIFHAGGEQQVLNSNLPSRQLECIETYSSAWNCSHLWGQDGHLIAPTLHGRTMSRTSPRR
jgi:hypothetical protein